MRKRGIPILVRLNAQEQQNLKKHVKKSGLSQEAFIRSLINGYIPKELPPLDYFSMIRELHAIGSNLNQIDMSPVKWTAFSRINSFVRRIT